MGFGPMACVAFGLTLLLLFNHTVLTLIRV